MIMEKFPEIARLSPEDKLLLVQELSDDVDLVPNEALLTPEQMAELEKRWEEYQRDPIQVTTWEAIQKRILGRTLDSE